MKREIAAARAGWNTEALVARCLRHRVSVRKHPLWREEYAMTTPTEKPGAVEERYQSVFNDVAGLIDAARRSAARSVNAVMTAAYWLIGRYIVEFEQRAKSEPNTGRRSSKGWRQI